MKAIEILVEEHRLILRGLAIGREIARRLRTGEQVEPEDASALGGFFREYADDHHHAKEENLLFPWMVRQGFPSESGPIHCMTREHMIGRKLRIRISEGASGLPDSALHLAHCLDEFSSLLEAHIQKENQMLYPMAENLGDGDEELLPAYQAANPDGESVESRFQKLIATLEKKYVPEPARSLHATV